MTRTLSGAVAAAIVLGSSIAVVNLSAGVEGNDPRLQRAVTLVEEFKTPGLESELSGVYPHPTDPDLYYVLANFKPPHRPGHQPMLRVDYRGKLLTVNRQGTVLKAVRIADDDYGGLTFVDGYLYAALTNAATIVKAKPETGEIVATYRLPSPAGGLEYDPARRALIAQLYVGQPGLAVVDIATGQIRETLWSDESAMGLVKVDGDWLCTWTSGWDPGSFSELRVIDQKDGHVRSRIRLDNVHSVLAPARTRDGRPAFFSLVTVDSESGRTVLKKYAYVGEHRW